MFFDILIFLLSGLLDNLIEGLISLLVGELVRVFLFFRDYLLFFFFDNVLVKLLYSLVNSDILLGVLGLLNLGLLSSEVVPFTSVGDLEVNYIYYYILGDGSVLYFFRGNDDVIYYWVVNGSHVSYYVDGELVWQDLMASDYIVKTGYYVHGLPIVGNDGFDAFGVQGANAAVRPVIIHNIDIHTYEYDPNKSFFDPDGKRFWYALGVMVVLVILEDIFLG
jgi:hypothetical protein